MNKKYILSLFAIFSLFVSLGTFAGTKAEAPRMSKEELRNRLGDKNTVIVDVRTEYDWGKSAAKIIGAVREYPQKTASWAKKYPKEKTIVLYCA
jgi:predicted sulfurtransferase